MILYNNSKFKTVSELKRILIQKGIDDISLSIKYIKEEDYKYLWSFQHKKNSGIVDSRYPQNLFDDIEILQSKGITLVIEDEELKEFLIKSGYEIINLTELTNKE